MNPRYFSIRSVGFLFWLILALLCGPGGSPGVSWAQTSASAAMLPATGVRHQGLDERQNQPFFFVENKGQAKKLVKYYHTGPAQSLWFTEREIALAVNSSPGPGNKGVVRLQPVGMSPGVKLHGAKPQPGKINYFNGNDPTKWLRGIPTYSELVYQEAYPGTDLRFYGNGLELEYDVILNPGADPARVRFRCQGIETMTVRPDGGLDLRLPGGKTLLQARPRVYQDIGGRRVAREATYTVAKHRGAWNYGFAVGPYDRDYPLVIDPVLQYSSYLGGTNLDEVRGIAVDPAGNVYLTGRTTSGDFPPLTSGLQGSDDCFVTKIDAQGKLVYSSYLGGGANFPDYDNEAGNAIAADAAGNAYVTGYTWSIDFPRVQAFQTNNAGDYDAFVAKLNPAGVPVFSSYLGGTGWDFGGRVWEDSPTRGGNAVAVDAAGNMYVVGYTDSGSGPGQFPVTVGAYQTVMKGSDDAFVAKVSPSGKLLYCTLFGGNVNDPGAYNEGAIAIAVDAAGSAYVTGRTTSSDFPLFATSFQKSNGGGYDGFVAKFNSTGTSLLYFSYMGGALNDEPSGIVVDEAGNMYLAGRTASADFPHPNGYQNALNGNDDAFALKVNADGTLAWSTFLGGPEQDILLNEGGTGIARDHSGNIYLTGYTWSADFPTLNPVQAKNQGAYDAFVAKIGPNGDKLLWSTYLGGFGWDFPSGIVVDKKGRVLVGGYTTSSNFPLKSAFQTALQGTRDGFVACLNQASHIDGIIAILLLEN